MFEKINHEFNQFEQDVRNKVYDVKYSREYLDLKDDLKSAAKKAKHIYNTDLKSAASNFGGVCKKIFRSNAFQRLIPIKS